MRFDDDDVETLDGRQRHESHTRIFDSRLTKNVTPIPTTLSRLLRTPFGIDLTFIRNEDHKKQYCTDAQAGDKIQFFLFVSDSSCNRSVVFSTF